MSDEHDDEREHTHREYYQQTLRGTWRDAAIDHSADACPSEDERRCCTDERVDEVEPGYRWVGGRSSPGSACHRDNPVDPVVIGPLTSRISQVPLSVC